MLLESTTLNNLYCHRYFMKLLMSETVAHNTDQQLDIVFITKSKTSKSMKTSYPHLNKTHISDVDNPRYILGSEYVKYNLNTRNQSNW